MARHALSLSTPRGKGAPLQPLSQTSVTAGTRETRSCSPAKSAANLLSNMAFLMRRRPDSEYSEEGRTKQ